MRIILKYQKNLFKQLQLDKTIVNQIENATLKTTLLRLYSNWIDLANSGLNSTRAQYINGLKILGGQANRNSGSVQLNGVLPNMLETGASSFDMKSSFSISDKRKFNKKGEWYLTIPMSDTARAISVLLNQDVNQKVTDLVLAARTQSSTATQNTPPKNLGASLIPKSNQSVIIGSVNQMFDFYKDKSQKSSSIDSGSIKRTGNVKFRRVSQRSDPNSWIHPGLQARNFGQQALERLKSEQDQLVENVVVGILKEKGIL